MITARELHEKILAISKNYLSGTPPIHIEGLISELNIPKEHLLPALKELEEKGLLHREDEFIKLSDLGSNFDL